MRLLYCGPPNLEREAFLSLLADVPHMELVGQAETGADAVQLARSQYPDVMVVDGGLVGVDAERIARTLALERPLPTLVLVEEGDEEVEETFRSLRIYRLAKTRLRQLDEMNRSYVRTRLNLLAARASEAKRTLPAESLSAVIDALMEEEADALVSQAVRSLAQTPLDLIVLAGGANGAELLAGVLPSVTSTRVPILIALEADASAMEQLREMVTSTRLPIRPLESSTSLRRAGGILVALAEQAVTVTPEMLRTGRGGLNLEQLLTSMGAVGRAGLSVLLAEGKTKGGAGLAAAERQDGLTATLAVHAFADPAASGAAGGGGRARPAMTQRELAWLLGAAVPRRV
jgi:chemotaxis response regulator CheB